jgi:glycosyltransferase involved in cell wall biosynthesis
VIYDCIDDKLAFSNVPKWMKIYLDILIEKSHLIFVTSSNLYRKIAEKRKDNVYLIGNGVDVALFKKAMTDIATPEDVKEVKKPIVGYIGAIDEWLDFDLIKTIATVYHDILIVLLGPVLPKAKKEVNVLEKFNNIFFVGKKSYDMLPEYLKAFDVCIIPFKINKLTVSANPVKLYEYLASGKNVVSTALPERKIYEKYKLYSKR